MAQDAVIKLVQGNQLPQYDIRDAEADEGEVFIDLERRDGTPYTCAYCGKVHVEKIAGLTPHSRQTDRFRAYLAAKCDDASVSAVARDYGLNDETVRRIDKEFLAKRELITPNRTCEVLGIDEIAIRKGHVYATVLYDHTRKSVIHMLQGRDKKSVHAFFKAQERSGAKA